MTRIEPPRRTADRYEWFPPAISALLVLAIIVLLIVAWGRFLDVSPRLGIDRDGRRIFSVAMSILELVLAWRGWVLGKRALRLWREARSGPGGPGAT